MKRVWTLFLLNASVLAAAYILFSTHLAGAAQAQAHTTSPHRYNELTIAGLRPGQDDLEKAKRLLGSAPVPDPDNASEVWNDHCLMDTLSVNTDQDGKIVEIRIAAKTLTSTAACSKGKLDRWATGHGIALGDSCMRVLSLYGQPGSWSSSLERGQQLELLYYAFDWAGPEVPQVMEVFCTPKKNRKPGHVVEIILAAPSL